MAPKILVVLTSHNQMGNSGKPTGWYLPEFAHAWDVFHAAGAQIIVASPAGGTPPVDPASVAGAKDDESSKTFYEQQKPLWENSAKVSEFFGKADQFDAVYFPGGHGPMYDLAIDPDTQKLAAEFWERGKVVSTVCHGTAALVNVKLSDGQLLLKGKTATGFANQEEDIAQLSQFMPFMLETKINEATGGKFVKANTPFAEKVVVEGKLITGQNPASSVGVAKETLKAIGV